jgi:hypothetical protein
MRGWGVASTGEGGRASRWDPEAAQARRQLAHNRLPVHAGTTEKALRQRIQLPHNGSC